MSCLIQSCSVYRPLPRFRSIAVAGIVLTLAACGGGGGSTDSGNRLATSPSSAKLEKIIEPALLASARKAERSFDYEAAAKEYLALLQRRPGDRDLTIDYARNLRYGGKADGAAALLNDWLKTNGDDARVLLEAGKAYLAADRLTLAESRLQAALALDPTNWDAYSSLGVALDYQDKHAEAQQQYIEALKHAPNHPTVLNNLGLSRAQTGDLPGATQALRLAVDQPAAGAQVRQNLALVLALSGDVEGADRLARKDLSPEMARKNAAYYRFLSGQP